MRPGCNREGLFEQTALLKGAARLASDSLDVISMV